MVAHLDAVTCLAVDPNGAFLMSGSKLGTLVAPGLGRRGGRGLGTGSRRVFSGPGGQGWGKLVWAGMTVVTIEGRGQLVWAGMTVMTIAGSTAHWGTPLGHWSCIVLFGH